MIKYREQSSSHALGHAKFSLKSPCNNYNFYRQLSNKLTEYDQQTLKMTFIIDYIYLRTLEVYIIYAFINTFSCCEVSKSSCSLVSIAFHVARVCARIQYAVLRLEFNRCLASTDSIPERKYPYTIYARVNSHKNPVDVL